MAERPDVSIVIVSYNKVDLLEQTLSSVSTTITEPKTEIIVVDNASSEMNIQMVQTKFPNVRLICSKQNLGFGSGCNIGAAASQGEVLLFINSDVKLVSNPVPGMLRLMKGMPDVGIVGCQMLNPDGSLQPSYYRFPGLLVRFLQVTGLKLILVRLMPVLRFQNGDVFESDMVAGAFFAIGKGLFDHVGGFDAEYFMYVEDADLCFRVRKAGGKVLVYNSNALVHFGLHKEDPDNPFLMYHYNRGLILFYEKHYSRFKRVVMLLMSVVAFGIRYVAGTLLSCAQTRQENMRLILQMYVKALRN